jgi:hypothetical protein
MSTMNNTKNILLVAAITSLLIVGTSIIPAQLLADKDDDEIKENSNFNSKIKASLDVEEKSASQHLDQANFCC